MNEPRTIRLRSACGRSATTKVARAGSQPRSDRRNGTPRPGKLPSDRAQSAPPVRAGGPGKSGRRTNPETKLANSIIKAINTIPGVYCWKRVVMSRRVDGRWMRIGVVGQSDIWGVMKGGRHFEIEVKRPGQKTTLEQEAWIENMRAFGCLAFVAHSVDEAIAEVKFAMESGWT